MSNKYSEALKLHISTDELRPWMQEPFKVGDLAIATDAHTMIMFNKSLIELELEDCKHNSSRVLNVVPTDQSLSFKIEIKPIREIIDSLEMVDEMEEVESSVQCNECDGDGEVEWEYEEWTKDDECPKCEGSGVIDSAKEVPTGNKIVPDGCFIEILQSRFSAYLIDRVIKTAELLEETEITLTSQVRASSANLFQIGEAKVLLMPYMKTEDQNSSVILIID